MKKYIILIIGCLFLTSCSYPESITEGYETEVIETKTQINEESKKVIEDINLLRDDYINKGNDEVDYLYVNAHEDGEVINRMNYDNYKDEKGEYFNELIKILDESFSPGIKDYINKIEKENIDEITFKKIGQTVIYVEPVEENKGKNYVGIEMFFSEIKKDNYREIFDSVSGDNYLLETIKYGDELDLIELINVDGIIRTSTARRNYYDLKSNLIRYNLLIDNNDIEKVNILIRKNPKEDLKNEDVEVFLNLLKKLNLPEEDTNKLLEEYRNVLQEKVGTKNLELNNCKLYINDKKGIDKMNEERNIYFSIEKLK